MKKYIDADKLIERLEEMKQAEYENCGGVNSKTGALQEVQELITSLQQEQPDADLEEEIERIIKNEDRFMKFQVKEQLIKYVARHFAEWGATHLYKKEKSNGGE